MSYKIWVMSYELAAGYWQTEDCGTANWLLPTHQIIHPLIHQLYPKSGLVSSRGRIFSEKSE
jgi:hypothetical protein